MIENSYVPHVDIEYIYMTAKRRFEQPYCHANSNAVEIMCTIGSSLPSQTAGTTGYFESIKTARQDSF